MTTQPTHDAVTLKDVPGRRDSILKFLIPNKTPRNSVTEPPQSPSILARLRSFLPQMAAANEALNSGDAEKLDVDVSKVDSDLEESDTSTDDADSSDEIESDEEKNPKVQFDLSLFRAQRTSGETDTDLRPEVDQLPEGFREAEDGESYDEPPADKKPKRLVEELDEYRALKILQRLGFLRAVRNSISTIAMASTTAAEHDVRGLEKLKDIYGDLAQVPVPSSGRIQRSGKFIQVTSVWDNPALPLKKNTKTQRSSVIERVGDTKELRLISTNSLPMTNFESQATAYSRSNSLVAQLITIPDGKDKKQYLRIFDQNEHIEVLCSDLSGQKKHGIIYGGGSGPFSALRFSHGEGHVLYCAERNIKTAQYYDADLEWDNDEKILESNVGKKFELQESWGESCADVKRPVLCIVDILSGIVTVLDQIPVEISPTFAIWAPDDAGVVFFGLRNEPFKLGRIY
ncbi:hypothetical protein ANCDUO_17007, partial [Ancylostoma duodenale]